MSKWSQTNLPCPDTKSCGSSDAYAVDHNGRGFCFSCKTFFENDVASKDTSNFDTGYVEHRGLSVETLKKFSILSQSVNGELVYSLARYLNGAIKIRDLMKKKFRSTGEMSKPMLFGMDKFPAGSLPSITICEGEYDAAASWQMLKNNSACVSVRSSSSALKDCQANWDYINSFEKIILCFDNDNPGNEALRECAGLFDFNKLFKVSLTHFKDPNDYLLKTKEDGTNYQHEFLKEWLSAKKYTPDSIISTFSEFREALGTHKAKRIATYPVARLNDMLSGLHQGEVVVVKGQEGIGKTEILRLFEDHLLKTTKIPIGIIHLEENADTTIQGIVSYWIGDRVDIDEGISNEDEVFTKFQEALGGDEGRVLLYNAFDTEEEKVFYDNIRFMVAVGGVKVIFFDHITWMATGADDNENERRKLDRISQRLSTMARELDFCLVMISHVNDDGKTRGSRNITKVANTVIHLDRNKEALSAEERNKMHLMIEKARRRGCQTGPAGFIIFDHASTNLKDVAAQTIT